MLTRDAPGVFNCLVHKVEQQVKKHVELYLALMCIMK